MQDGDYAGFDIDAMRCSFNDLQADQGARDFVTNGDLWRVATLGEARSREPVLFARAFQQGRPRGKLQSRKFCHRRQTLTAHSCLPIPD